MRVGLTILYCALKLTDVFWALPRLEVINTTPFAPSAP